jgi:hypothetical protein
MTLTGAEADLGRYYCPCHGYRFFSREALREHCKEASPP